jgi:hypothetical protein
MRTSIAAVAAALVLLACAGVANGTTLEIAPAGRTRAVSNGLITFTGSELSFTCAVTLIGSLASRTEGTVGVLEPASNPRLGNFSSGTVNECSGGEARLSFPGRSWEFYVESFEGPTSRTYVQNAQLLITAGGGVARCLYEARIAASYRESGTLSITGMTVLRQTALTICPTRPSISGSFTVNAEESGAPQLGPDLNAEPGTLEYGGRLRTLTVRLTNRTRSQIQISHLVWSPAGSEMLWRVLNLTCGTIEAGGSCSIEIESILLSPNATIEIQNSDNRQLVAIDLHR